jgi:hypothetical protein
MRKSTFPSGVLLNHGLTVAAFRVWLRHVALHRPIGTPAAILKEERRCSKTLDVDHVVTDCIQDQFGDGMNVELAHEIGAMGLSGLHTEIQGNGYFF